MKIRLVQLGTKIRKNFRHLKKLKHALVYFHYLFFSLGVNTNKSSNITEYWESFGFMPKNLTIFSSWKIRAIPFKMLSYSKLNTYNIHTWGRSETFSKCLTYLRYKILLLTFKLSCHPLSGYCVKTANFPKDPSF